MKTFRKILKQMAAITLSAAMMLTMLPAGAYAQEETVPEETAVTVEQAEEEAAEETEETDARMLGTSEDAKAEVLKGSETQEYDDFDQALEAWNNAGGGTTLKLLSDISIDSSIVLEGDTSSEAMTLDLNGHGILHTGGSYVIDVNKKSLILTDSCVSPETEYITHDENGCGIEITEELAADKDQIEVTGGFITGGKSGGVYVNEGRLIMNGGTICANTTENAGGGVYVYGAFILNDGNIFANRASDYGGGVYIMPYPYGNFFMNGGKISGNTAGNGTDTGEGGGVYSNGGAFTMTGGEISGNAAGAGGAAFYENLTEYHEQSHIRFNGNVYAGTASDHGSVTKAEAISHINEYDYLSVEEGDANVAAVTTDGRTVLYDDFDMAADAWTFTGSGATLQLLTDINMTKHILIDKGTEKNPMVLDLNDHGLMVGDAEVALVISDGYLRVEDTADAPTQKYVTLGEDGRGTAVDTEPTEGADQIEITGGYITGGNHSSGGCVSITYGGCFVMDGGTFCGNTGTSGGAVGIMDNREGTIIMNGGMICHNRSGYYGGGVYVSSDGSFTMNGGEISYNYAYDFGAGVYHLGKVTLNRGVIRNNTNGRYDFGFVGGGGTLEFGGTVRLGEEEDGSDLKVVPVDEAKRILYQYRYVKVDKVVATVITNAGVAEDYENMNEAVGAWNAAGADAILKLQNEAAITETIRVTGGTETKPMILDLNDHGLRIDAPGYEMTMLIVEEQAFLEITDNSSFDTKRYVTVPDIETAAEIYDTKPSDDIVCVEVTGGFIAGGAGYDKGSAIGIFGHLTLTDGTICANIKDRYSSGSVFCKGEFIMNGGAIRENDEYDSAVRVTPEGTFIFNDGKISDNHCRGVLIEGTFIMNGGEISGNEESGIYADFQGSFVMNGGEIKGNRSSWGGGGVYFESSKSFIMNGGTIKDNEATVIGGGVDVSAGRFVMNGGRICGNVAAAKGDIGGVGGGVDVQGGRFEMYGGEIFENTAEIAGGGVASEYDGAFHMYSGVIRNNTAPDGPALYDENEGVHFNGDVFASVDPDGTGALRVKITEAKENIESYGYVYMQSFRHAEVKPVTYTGSALKPEVKVYYGLTLLEEKKDYTISYSKNTNAGEGTFTVTGKGNYSGKDTGTFEILPKNIEEADVDKAEIAPAKYNAKKAYMPVPVLTYNKKKLAIKKDFTVEYYKTEACDGDAATPQNPGTYYAKVTGKNGSNYTGSVVLPFEITNDVRTPVSKFKIEKIPDREYQKGIRQTPKPGISLGGAGLTENTDYTLSWGENTDAGIGTVTITGKGSYYGSRTVTFNIKGIPVNKVKTEWFVPSMPYSGSAKTQDELKLTYQASVRDEPEEISFRTAEEYEKMQSADEKADVNCIVSYKNNVNAGTATMTLTGIHGCTGTVNKTFKITPFDLSVPAGRYKVELDRDNREYGYAAAGVKPQATVLFRINGEWKKLTEGKDYTIAYSNNNGLNDGTKSNKRPTVKITGKGNFKGTDTSTTFKIVAANMVDAGLKVVASDVVFAENKAGNWKSKKIQVIDRDGKILKAGTDYEKVVECRLADDANADVLKDTDKVESAGTTVYVTVKAKANGKYSGTLKGTYRIGKYDISKLTVSVDPKTYTGRAVTLTDADLKWKNRPAGDFYRIDNSSYRKNVNKGKATVDVIGQGDYCGRKTISYTIGAKGVLWWFNNLFN